MTYLQKLLVSDGAFVTPAHVLESLPVEAAKVRPAGAPHSLYEEFWHINFWQHLILYHVGRMVLLRQLMGLWPPPSGGDTWWVKA